VPGIVTAPNVIEQTDFSGGWQPDLEPALVPPNGLLDAVNILPDIGTAALQVRQGFKRLIPPLVQGYRIESIHAYNRLAGASQGQYLIMVLTNGLDGNPNNIMVYAVNLQDGTAARVDTANIAWNSSDGTHWGATINQTFYGGGPGDLMYSWNPVDGWSRNPSGQTFPTLVTNFDPSPSQRDKTYAFRKGDKIQYASGDASNTPAGYAATKGNRFNAWATGKRYTKGAKVSYLSDAGAHGGTAGKKWMRSFEAKVTHTASGSNHPDSGAGLWVGFNLDVPRDDDNELSEDWSIVPSAGTTNVGVWHADRMWLRYDDVDSAGKSLLQFSSPAHAPTDGSISTPVWDPQDWSTTPDEDTGDRGGFLPVNTGDGDDIVALWNFGFFLIICKRRTTWVKAGLSEPTWVVRKLGNVGAVSSRSITEHDGFVYFISDEGLYRTDGTNLEPAPGADRVADWLRNSVNWEATGAEDFGVEAVVGSSNNGETAQPVTMWSFGGYVWIALATHASRVPNQILVYDPHLQSNWLLTVAVQAACLNRIRGVEQLFFSSPSKVGEAVGATVEWLGIVGRSQSQRTLSGITEINLIANPSFSVLAGESLEDARDNSKWHVDGPNVAFALATAYSLEGPAGAVVKNNGKDGTFKGIHQTFAEANTNQHTISGYFQRAQKTPLDYSILRWAVDDEVLPPNQHKFIYQGDGWWRIVATYAGSTSPRLHGFVLSNDTTVHADKFLAEEGGPIAAPWFDGDVTDDLKGVGGGDWSMLYQYNHPDVQDVPTDDNGQVNYLPVDIPWSVRSCWFTFGGVREERRIRRVWSLVRGMVSGTLRQFRNFSDDSVAVAEQRASTPVATYFEGRRMPDCYSVNFSLEGIGAPASILSFAADTQPRRVRYHK
jgi:hypothetical protein